MEETTVLIVGAGPSGLALGALLARMNIKVRRKCQVNWPKCSVKANNSWKVVVLEKEVEVCEDPRGIVVNGDAVRISYQIGIGEGLTKRIGKGQSPSKPSLVWVCLCACLTETACHRYRHPQFPPRQLSTADVYVIRHHRRLGRTSRLEQSDSVSTKLRTGDPEAHRARIP